MTNLWPLHSDHQAAKAKSTETLLLFSRKKKLQFGFTTLTEHNFCFITL